MPETIKLFGISKIKITIGKNGKNGKNVPHLEITEIIIIHRIHRSLVYICL